MAWTLDKIEAELKRAEQIQPRSSVSQAQVDAAAQATMSQNQIAPTGGSLVEKATRSVGLITDNGQFTATKPRRTEVELPGIHDNTARKIDRLQNRMQSKQQDDTEERIRSLEQQAINYSNAGMTEQMLQVQKELDELKQSSDQGKLDALKAQRAEEKAAVWQAEQDKRMQDYVNLQAEKDFSTLAGQGMSADGWSKEELEKRISETDMEISKLIASGQFEEADNKKKELDSLYKMRSMGKYGEDAERDTYSYLLAKDAQTGSNEAQEYLKFMENTMNYRQGKEQAEKIQGIESDALRTLAIGAHSVASGVANAGAGYNQLLNGDEPIATSPMQYASQEIQEDLGNAGKLLYSAGSSVGNMLPSILLSTATGGLGASAAVAGGIGAAAMGASSAGNTYTQAVKEGYSPEQAKTYAALVGASEASLQYLLGGISKLGGVTDDVLLAKVSKLDNALARVAATGAVKLGSEIGEEELQLHLEPLIKSVVFGEEYKKPGFDEVLETALVTALSTGALEGKAILSAGKNTNKPNAPKQTNNAEQEVSKQPVSEVSYSAVENILSSGKVNNTLANEIINNAETAQAFTDITGVALEGTTEQKRQAIRDTVREWQNRVAENEALAREAGEQTTAEYEKAKAEQVVRDSGYRSYVIGMLTPNGTNTANAQEILRSPELRAEWEAVTGKKLPENYKSALKMIEQTKRDPLKLSLQDETVDATKRKPETPRVEDIMPNAAPTVDVDAAVNSVRAEATAPVNTSSTTNTQNADTISDELNAQTKRYPTYGDWTVYRTRDTQRTDGATITIRNRKTGERFTERVDNGRYKTNSQLNYIAAQMLAEHSKAQNSATDADVDAALNNVRAEGTGTVGDMGAKTSEFPHEVKESQSKTTPRYYEQYNIPEEGRADNHYTARTWDEARNNARVKLEQDYAGEVEDLTRKTTWSDEEVFEAEAILADLRQKAKETNDWGEHQKWSKVFAQHKEELGRAFSALRGLGKNTAETILADASASLENAAKGTDVNTIMREVDRHAEQYDAAVKNKDVDGLVKIIRDTSAIRKTDTRKGGLSKEINWALERIAEYARAEAANAKQTGSSEVGRFYDFLQNFAANDIKAIATDKQKVSFGEGYRTIQHNSILSKVATVLRNIVSNLVLDPMDSLSGNIAVPLDALLSTFTKTRSVAYDNSWFSEAKRKGSLDGLAMALLEVGLDVNSEGKSGKYENVGKRTFHSANGGVAKLISTWEKYSGYAMTATDEFSKGGTEAEVQRGIDKLYEQNKIKDDSLRNAGEQAALYRTLQDETVPSKIVVGARNALNHAHAGDLGLGDVLVKFAQVPANVPARAADFSPVGIARGIGKLAKVLVDAKNGNLTAAQQASAVKDIGRGITGCSLIVASTALTLKGIIRVVSPGGEEEHKDKAASEQAQGLKETQINLSAFLRSDNGGDGKWRDDDVIVSLGFLEPINANLMTGALIAEDIEEARKNGEKLSIGDVLTDSLEGTIHALLDLPLMDPIKDMYYAYQKSDGENEVEKVLDVGNQALAGEATSFIPNALKGIAQGLDPYQRDMYTKGDIVGRTLDQVIGGIPGLRNKLLPTKQDVYGNDIENPEPFLNFMNANILPGAITRYKETETQAALNALSEETGENTMYLSKTLPKYVTVDGNKVDLTNDQQRQFNSARGDAYEVASAALENDKNYQQVGGDFKLKAYAFAEDYANQMAKAELGIGYEPDTWVSELEGASPEELAKAFVGKALDSVGGYGDKEMENVYRKAIYDPAWSVVDEGVLDKAMEYATKFNDAETKAQMGYEMEADWMLEAKSMGIHAGRTDYFIKKAVEAQAKKVGGTKYEGLEMLLESGEINGKAALLAMPDGAVDAYNEYCSGNYVTPEEWVDVYGYMNSLDGSGSENKEATLKYIDGLKLVPKQKAALAQALYAANPDFIPKTTDIPNEWLLDIGADASVIVGQFSDSQKEAYSTYIEPAGVDMKWYLDAVEFNGNAKADKNAKGETISGSKRDKVIKHIDSMKIDKAWKRAIYLSLGYSSKNMPRSWK